MPDLRFRLEAAVMRGVLNLPPRLQRRLVRRPLVVDGLTLSTEVQAMLWLKRVARIKDFATFPLERARHEVTRQAQLVGGHQDVGALRDLTVDGAEGPLRARLYLPTSRLADQQVPTMLYLHGGGFVYGDLESHDAALRFIAETSGVQVLSIEYRLAPEHPFPAAVHDCVAAYRWLVEHADEVHADPGRLAVGGDSAGGNLAAVVALHAAEEGLPLALQLLLYPGTDLAGESRSVGLFQDLDLVLTRSFLDVARGSYLPDVADRSLPDASPLRRPSLPEGIAPAHVVTGGFDPLRDEGEAYARKLQEAGVQVHLERYDSMVHAFMHVVGGGRETRSYVGEIAGRLGAALS